MAERRMTARQRRLVADNLGLVRLHIRRQVRGLGRPTRDREWDDLFQEGCLGLALAACTHEPSKGVPFAAFALRRIQSAVNRALHRAFATVRVPDGERAGGGRCKVVSLDFDPDTRASANRHRPDGAVADETIGGRIRGKYDGAVRGAVEAVKSTGKCDRKQSALLDRLVGDRLLVPNEECRVSLRQMARDTQVSYARVAYTEKRLQEQIRSTLALDAELPQLRAEARRSDAGFDAEIDDDVRWRLAAAVTSRFARLYRAATPGQQGAMLLQLLQNRSLDAGHLAQSLFDRSAEAEKTKLLSWLAAVKT